MSSRISIICVWLCFISLLVLGVVMVASTGLSAHIPNGGTQVDYIIKQCRYGLAGLVVALFISRYDYHKLRRWVWPLWGLTVALLICCFLPKIGQTLNGESRWIKIGFTFQPSELAKIALMLWFAHWYSTYREVAGRFWKGFALPGIAFGVPLILILMEKDMGTAAALAMCGFCVMYSSGARWWLILLAMLLGAVMLYELTAGNPNRMARIDAWLDPEAYSLLAGRQQWVSMLALARGGGLGVGLGDGIQKFGALPFAHTDFIFAEIGEEFGLLGTVGVLLLFTFMAASGIIMAVQTHDTFGRTLAIGLVCVIFWPAALNMMVVTSVLPNTGLPLPLISYGGTNLVFTISAIGLLTSIQRHTPVLRTNYWPRRRQKELPPDNIGM